MTTLFSDMFQDIRNFMFSMSGECDFEMIVEFIETLYGQITTSQKEEAHYVYEMCCDYFYPSCEFSCVL